MAHTALAAAFVWNCTQVVKGAMKKSGIHSQWCSEFLCLSLFIFQEEEEHRMLRAKMEFPQRVSYRHWLGRNGVFCAFVFQLSKVKQGSWAHSGGYPHCAVDFLSDISIVIQIGKLSIKKQGDENNFKGLSQDKSGQIRWKSPHLSI